MKIIKDYAKKNNFKTITLYDESNYICKNTQFDSKYSLKYGSVLTSGQPWYYKYDFVYIDKNHDIVLYNQEKIKRLKTTDLPFEILIYILSSSILQKYILKINSVHYVIFLILLAKNIVSKKYCDVFSLICLSIFDILQLKTYTNEKIKMICYF